MSKISIEMERNLRKVNISIHFFILDFFSSNTYLKKYLSVSRIVCVRETDEMDRELDVNVEIFPIDYNERFTIVLTLNLNLDDAADEGGYDPRSKDKMSLMDKYDYVMFGKVF